MTHPQASITIRIEDGAFTQPSPEEFDRNPTYYQGYSVGQAASAALPSPAGSKTYENYREWCGPLLLPAASPEGFVNNTATGFNNAMIDGLNWLWRNDPMSPFKVPA
jgi:hypothetical protein